MTVLTSSTVVLVGAAVLVVSQRNLHQSLDEALVGLARTELASATDTGFVHVHESGPQTLTLQGVPSYEKFVWVIDHQDKIVARTSNVGDELVFRQSEPFAQRARGGKTVFGDFLYNGHEIRAVFYPFKNVDDSPLVGVVGVPTSVLAHTIEGIQQAVVIVGLACVFVAILVILWLANSLSKPLRSLAHDAVQIDLVHPDEVQPLHAPYQEINGVALAINRLVSRVARMLGERNAIISGQRQFIADASHELRTPVSNIQGTIEVALRRERTLEEYRRDLEVSLGEANRMGRLINDLLALAKTDLGEFRIVPTRTDLADIARRSINILESGSRSLPSIQVNTPTSLVVYADEDRMRQALDNLLTNAVIHASTTIQITVREDSGRAFLEVRNDGPELSPEESAHVFDRFYRSDASRSRDSGGSGLGLAIVKAIVEGHSGTVSCQSDSGWTTFTISLPIQVT